MNTVLKPNAYSPINCDVYDMLEELSTLRQNCEIVYVADAITGKHTVTQGRITNLYAHRGEEFLVLTASEHNAKSADTHVRLDNLVSINGINTRVQDACDIADVFKELHFRKFDDHAKAKKNDSTQNTIFAV
jgi:transcriptional antiterminator Rof (Rho-off)